MFFQTEQFGRGRKITLILVIISVVFLLICSHASAVDVRLNSVADASISEAKPTENYGSFSTMTAGRELDTGLFRSFVRFDLSKIPPGAQITSASFNAYVVGVAGSPKIKVSLVFDTWDEYTVNWNNHPQRVVEPYFENLQVASEDRDDWVQWDITNIVGAWKTGTPNYGLMLSGPEDSWVSFNTRESANSPYLFITYTLPDTEPPDVSIRYSPDCPTSSDGIIFTATATDDRGIQSIKIWVNGNVIRTCDSSPCITDPRAFPEGTAVTYSAEAVDGAGNVGNTITDTFIIGACGGDTERPEVSVSHSPRSPTSSDGVTFTADATDESGIDWIKIWVNGAIIRTCDSSPCVTDPPRPYPEGMVVSYYAEAMDEEGNYNSTGTERFTVGTPPDMIPPEVSINHYPDSPTSETPVNFIATASDPISGIEWIRVYVNGALMEECDSSPCIYYADDPFSAGTLVTYHAAAKDTAQNLGETGDKSFRVGTPPVITIPEVEVTYNAVDPFTLAFKPKSGGTVTERDKIKFSVIASDPEGISRILLFVDLGTHIGASTEVANCTTSRCEYTGGPYPVGSIQYSALAYDTTGIHSSTSGTIQIEMIPCSWCGDNVEPFILHGQPSDVIDVILIPDVTYGGDIDLFLDDLQDAIENGYYTSDVISANQEKINFYYIMDEAHVTGYPSCEFAPPLDDCDDFKNAVIFADSIGVLHQNDFRDWAGPTDCDRRVFTSEPTSYRTIVHESGHSLFGLKDEYCCDSHYSQNNPNPNIWSDGACQDDALNEGWNPDDCVVFCPLGSGNCGRGYQKIDPPTCVMHCSQSCLDNCCSGCGGFNAMCQFGEACLRRINAIFDSYQ